MSKRHPLKRNGTTKDIAKAAISEENIWITWQEIGVDAGLSTLKIS